MADSILLTMADLEVTVRTNAVLESEGAKTTLVSAMDDLAAAVSRSEPEVLVLTGALHERQARHAVAMARERSISTLGVLPVRIEVDIHQQAMANIRKGLEEQKTAENPDWGFYWRAAKYLLDRGDELELAQDVRALNQNGVLAADNREAHVTGHCYENPARALV